MIVAKALGLLLVATAGTLSAAADATTLDFNTLRNADPSSYTYVQGPYKEKGYTLSASLCQSSLGVPNAGCFLGVQPFKSMDPVGASLATQFVSPTVTVTRDNGAAFLLQSIDFAEYFDNGIYAPFTTDVNFSFLFANGTTGTATRTFSNDGRYVPTTFSFDLAPLRSFSWTPVTGGGVQFDNIVLGDIATAVPEAGTWALLILGFGMVGGTMRRRSMRIAFA